MLFTMQREKRDILINRASLAPKQKTIMHQDPTVLLAYTFPRGAELKLSSILPTETTRKKRPQKFW
jgi:hypothetical protein